jgi:hypothetical protein
MSKVFDKIKSEENLDVALTMRGKENGVYLVEASITRFKTREGEKGGADVVKKVNAYAEAKTLVEAQDKALEKAGELLGLGG